MISGLAASPGRACGRARVVLNAADLPELENGVILVTRFAVPEIVVSFGRIGGFVTDQGGRLAHASVVAREFGIPAVVGTQYATQLIEDGSAVVVDGDAGTVVITDPIGPRHEHQGAGPQPE